MEPIVTAERISKSFGRQCVFEDLSLSVAAGSILGVVGLNGMGKTTLIRLLLGLIRAGGGTIRVCGMDPWKHERELYRRVGVVLDHDGLYGNFTVRENVEFFAGLKGLNRSSLDGYVAERWPQVVPYYRKVKVKQLSKGQKKQASLCRAFLGRPAVCFLDEPAISLDVRAFDHLQNAMKRAAGEGTAIVISSHQLDIIENVCDTVAVIENRALRPLDDRLDLHDVKRPWVIRGESDPRYGRIITDVCGGPSVRDGEKWRFVPNSDEDIPAIVRSLVEAGFAVREIRPEHIGLHERIRRVYQCS